MGNKAGRKRNDFPAALLRKLAGEVGHRCSNPTCDATTIGPSRSRGTSNTGVGAHITAASSGGPRFDASLTPAQRRAASNAIWLCASCARLIDNDNEYTVDVLLQWKASAIERAALAQRSRSPAAPPRDSAESRAHDAELFRKSDRKMSESNLLELIRGMSPLGPRTFAMRWPFEWWSYFELESNQFLDPTLHARCAMVHELVGLLLRDVAEACVDNDDGVWVVLPDLPRDAAVVAETIQLLREQLDAVLAAFRTYRRAIKSTLIL